MLKAIPSNFMSPVSLTSLKPLQPVKTLTVECLQTLPLRSTTVHLPAGFEFGVFQVNVLRCLWFTHFLLKSKDIMTDGANGLQHTPECVYDSGVFSKDTLTEVPTGGEY